MLRADRIKLAILDLIVKPHNTEGASFKSLSLSKTLSAKIADVSQHEAIDELDLLWQEKCVSLYDDNRVPYHPDNRDHFFYDSHFHCAPLPLARRRQQELAQGNRSGIFISHVSEEFEMAARIKVLLQASLANTLPVFVSSDFLSIKSGEPWYDRILEGIRKSQVILCLLSPNSIERRWINFEAGVGVGSECPVVPVVPVVWHRQSKGGIGMPLGHHQSHDLSVEADLTAMLTHLGTICTVPVNMDHIASFLRDLPEIEARTKLCDLEVTVFRSGMVFCLAIRNVGNRPLDMIDAELLLPAQLGLTLRAYSPVRETATFSEDGQNWRGYRLTTTPSTHLHLGIEPLRKKLVPEMGEICLTGVNIALSRVLSVEEEQLSIRYRVLADQITVAKKVPIANLPHRDS